MFKSVFDGEGKLFAWVSANVSLGGVHILVQKIKPELDALLVVLQIVVASGAAWHIIQKFVEAYKAKKNETAKSNSPGA